MRTLRAIYRTLKVALWTLAGSLGLTVARIVQPFSPRLRLRIRNATYRAWARGLCRAFGVRVRVEGRPPDGCFFLVSNHVSYIDIPLIASVVDATFIAKSEIAGWPAVGGTFAAADTIFVDRSRRRDLLRVLEQVDHAFGRGLAVVLFPEGTSGRGASLLPFKPSILELPAARGQAVHFATLSYSTPEGELPAQRSVCWWGDEALLPHYRRLSRLPYIDAVLRFGEQPIAATDRKRLAGRLRQEMEAIFEPME